MKFNRKTQEENAIEIMRSIEKCETEADLEKVDDRASELVLIGGITKKAYRTIDEMIEDQIMFLVETGKI